MCICIHIIQNPKKIDDIQPISVSPTIHVGNFHGNFPPLLDVAAVSAPLRHLPTATATAASWLPPKEALIWLATPDL